MNEEWRDIKGYEGHYQISSLGRVKSLHRTACHEMRGRNFCQTYEEKIMKQLQQCGYLCVWIQKGTEMKKKFRVHRLVAQAFIPNPEGKEFVNHKNKDRANNTVENLEWCTHEENMIHRDTYCVSNEPF